MKIYRITTDKGCKWIECKHFVKSLVHTGEALELLRSCLPDHDGSYTKIVNLLDADIYDSLEDAVKKAKYLRSKEIGQYPTIFRIHIQDLDVEATEKAKEFCLERGLTKPYGEYDRGGNDLYPLIYKCQANGWDFLDVIQNLSKAYTGVGPVEVLLPSKAEKLLLSA
uniref:Uncharacterized protein n=2 Tax=unclassified bacterial viruses TaxID=12333 RepID=A0AAU6VZK6_9VIRU